MHFDEKSSVSDGFSGGGLCFSWIFSGQLNLFSHGFTGRGVLLLMDFHGKHVVFDGLILLEKSSFLINIG